MKKNILDIIKENVGFFNEIPKTELSELIRHAKTININKDDFFLQEGDIPQRIGFVRSGVLRLFYIDSTGKDVTKHFCTEHSLAISYSGFIQQQPSRFYIQALEKTKLSTIDKITYDYLLERNVCWQITARKLAEMVFIIKERREAELLLYDAQERYLRFLKDYPNLINRIKHYHISSYLGITPESLSRIRAQLK